MINSGNDQKQACSGGSGAGASVESGVDLQKLADLITQRWPGIEASFVASQYLWIGPFGKEKTFCNRPDLNVDCSDEGQSKFIIWGLDRLEELDLHPTLFKVERDSEDDPEGYVVEMHSATVPIFGGNFFSEPQGKTRAEAVASALVLALSNSEQNGPNNKAPIQQESNVSEEKENG